MNGIATGRLVDEAAAESNERHRPRRERDTAAATRPHDLKDHWRVQQQRAGEDDVAEHGGEGRRRR